MRTAHVYYPGFGTHALHAFIYECYPTSNATEIGARAIKKICETFSVEQFFYHFWAVNFSARIVLCVTNSIFCVCTLCFAGIQRSMLSNGKCSESLRKCGKKKLRNFFLHIKFDTLLDFCANTYLGRKCPFLGVWAWYFTCSLILWPSKVVHAKSWTWGTQKLMPARLPGLQNSTIKVRFVAQTHI